MNVEKKELSFDELMEKLRDPALLQAAAAKAGLVLAAPKREEAAKKREMPKLELPEDATPAQIAEAFNKGLQNLVGFFQAETEEKTSAVRQEVSRNEQAKIAKDIKAFATSKKDFDELLPMIEPFWNTGKYSIQEAYELGRKASGKAPEKAAGSSTTVTPAADTVVLSKTSEEDGTRSALTAKPKSIRETAKESLNNILQKNETLSEGLEDGDAL
jgi:hypothetical protein